MNKTINIKGFLVKQLTKKPIVTTSIKFTDLIDFVKFTAREAKEYDPFDPEKSIEKIAEDINDIYFQRLTNERRVKNIYAFLLKEINNIHNRSKNALGSFPTAIIISMDVDEYFDDRASYEKHIETLDINEKIGAFYEVLPKNEIELIIPNRRISLIVDGQHRLAAMLKLYNDAKENTIKIGRNSLKQIYPLLSNDLVKQSLNEFELNCTLLVGFDIWEQGKVFADVNFNQKPVNKSLYYDIFGSFPDPDKNEIFLAHMLAMHLNNSEKSVIKGFIKMLGTGSGYFSQAFFVEAILNHFNTKGIWSDLPKNYREGGDEYKILPKFFISYLKAIKTVFIDYWPKKGEKYKNILVKTTGMGALIRLINPIYRHLIRDNDKIDINEISTEELTKILTELLLRIKPKAKEYFSAEGEFAGAGSLGLQNKLYKKMGVDLGYFKE